MPSDSRARRLYHGYHSLFPAEIDRYVVLFERILARCVDVIRVDYAAGRPMPALSIRPIHLDNLGNPYKLSVARHSTKPLSVEVPVPAQLIRNIRSRLRRHEGPLDYMLVSETEIRVLRAIFPLPETVSRVVHLGFYHLDNPGALRVIMAAVVAAQFNILTSLLRQNEAGKNNWEALLEYRGSQSNVPEDSVARHQWAIVVPGIQTRQ